MNGSACELRPDVLVGGGDSCSSSRQDPIERDVILRSWDTSWWK